jgi:ribonuclease HII
VEPTDIFETEARRCGFRLVAGLDEAGRGPLAGPVVAAAVILPRRCEIKGLNDSKQVTKEERDRLYGEISARAVALGVGLASVEEIDRLNILQATRVAMVRAIQGLLRRPDFLLVDAVSLPALPLPQRAIIKGDGLSVSIAAASIIAKVSRDRLMLDYHRQYPRYNFQAHKGYTTEEHLRLLAEHGPCDIHRKSFRPVWEAGEPLTFDWEQWPEEDA